mmetsp:Transcript_19529/g.43191  ORF Transcript_19529/g.43191 Transcript_19529/m.43191 type:complete len:498 (+) Transcript_19529:2-1495(+)
MLPASLSARWLPREYVETTAAGGCCTLVAYAVMLSMFLLQLRTFLNPPVRSTLEMDQDVRRPTMQINFDVDMHDIECRNLRVQVLDDVRREPIEVNSQRVMLTNIDRDGTSQGIYGDLSDDGAPKEETEEEHQAHAQRLAKKDGKSELDADWADSHDGFKHQSFQHVVQFHDFTLVNFFATWCSHCQKFAPAWKTLAEEIRKRKDFIDRDGKSREVWPIKMNCVDFKPLCREVGIDAFPTIRLYKSDGSFSRYDGARDLESILRWIELVVRTKSSGWKKKHEAHELGCNVRGFVQVPRVPGQLQLLAGEGDQDLEPTMTNVSHLVRHLSFSDPDALSKFRLPSRASGMGVFDQVTRRLSPASAPLDGQGYSTHAFHQEVEHHLNVVSIVSASSLPTASRRQRVQYNMVHYQRTAKVPQDSIPQARFHFDLEAFGIRVEHEELPWYDFATSLLAMLGGIFVLVRLLQKASRGFAAALLRAARKNGTSKVSVARAGLVQ